MKYIYPPFILLIFLLCLAPGQADIFSQSFKGSLNPFPDSKNSIIQPDTLRILAIMVNFQEDRDGATFGNGKFGSIYSQNYGNDILDPLPHDKSYFEYHLLFAKNYFENVSKGNLTLEYTVLPDTFSVSAAMRNYSPDPGSNDFKPVGDFSIEAWTKADQLNPGFPFSDYDIFLVFHAGVGRDVTLPGSIGNERDIPSVYLSENTFKNIYGENFPGIPVSGGTFNIKNTMIIPETESRELETISGSFLFELTINGLLCASIGSYFGVPDLFDTETGLSAIGRFGLMDGQGIFAYNGCYPPEPSPWVKIFLSDLLGWNFPVAQLDLQNEDINLVTNIASTISDTVILKIPINSSEYFLVENRIRDANNDGSKVTYVLNGNTFTHTFTKDTTGYYSFDTDSLSGVITDVDEFDWAVPGNGIVIWHIDENVINEKIADNKINTDKNHRGVDVEEADGIQDIGEIFYDIFGNQVIGEGTEDDFWYSSNPSTLFENRFAVNTKPDTRTNSGANSLITFKDFSEIGNRMSFRVEFGDSVVKPLTSIQLDYQPFSLSSVVFNDNVYLIIVDINYETLKIFENDSLIYQTQVFSNNKPAVTIYNNKLYVFGEFSTRINYWITDGITTYPGQFETPIITTNSVINTNLSGEKELWFGTYTGKIYKYSLGDLPNVAPELKDSISFGDYAINYIAVAPDYFAAAYTPNISTNDVINFSSSSGDLVIENEIAAGLALTKDQEGNFVSFILTQQGNIYIINNGIIIKQFEHKPDFMPADISLTDLKKDGNIYLLAGSKSLIQAYNFEGSLADNFPVSPDKDFENIFAPVSADIEGDDHQEILFATPDGDIYAYDGGSGKVIPGFPISLGNGLTSAPSLYLFNGKVNLAAACRDSSFGSLLKVWSVSSINGKINWKEENANNENTSFIDAAENINRINEFFPSGRAYNYPNPVYEGTTNIRYYVSEDSKISIKIFDLAGDYVAELNDDAQGGMDNETTWNVNNIQSGVYLARIEATSTSGKSEQAIIKIAVVK